MILYQWQIRKEREKRKGGNEKKRKNERRGGFVIKFSAIRCCLYDWLFQDFIDIRGLNFMFLRVEQQFSNSRKDINVY